MPGIPATLHLVTPHPGPDTVPGMLNRLVWSYRTLLVFLFFSLPQERMLDLGLFAGQTRKQTLSMRPDQVDTTAWLPFRLTPNLGQDEKSE